LANGRYANLSPTHLRHCLLSPHQVVSRARANVMIDRQNLVSTRCAFSLLATVQFGTDVGAHTRKESNENEIEIECSAFEVMGVADTCAPETSSACPLSLLS